MTVMKEEHLKKDIAFTEHMACAKRCPVAKIIPDNMKEKLDVYLGRKRDTKK